MSDDPSNRLRRADPAEKYRVARRLAALMLGIDEKDMPPDAEVGMSIDRDTVHVEASVVVPAKLDEIQMIVRLVADDDDAR